MTSGTFPILRLGVLMVAVVTGAHIVARLLAPFESIHPEWPVWLDILLFNGLLVTAIVLGARPAVRLAGRHPEDWQAALSATPTAWLLGISLSGLVFHGIAKASLVTSIPLDCLGMLRGAWIHHDRSADPLWIRISSMLGHIGSHFAMPGLLLSAFQITHRVRSRPWLAYAGFAGVVIVYAAAIVSRSTVLSALVITALGVMLGIAGKGGGLRRLHRGALAMALFLGLALAFNYLVFKAKIDCGNHQTETRYVESNLVGTDVKLTSDSLVGKSFLTHSVLPTLQYLNHAIWNYSIILDTDRRGSSLLFGFVGDYLQRLGLAPPGAPKTRVHSLGGATLPGAAFHDYGIAGLAATAVAVGAWWVLGAALLVRGRRWRYVGLACLVGAGLSIAMNLLFVAPATMSFPFTLFAFLVCAGILPADGTAGDPVP
ncbi:MAG: hypothetical protein EBQ76_01390 [Betaproteobacteria bacterium]|nr:hypothetical protein [Betaproteobacteria bacterium]